MIDRVGYYVQIKGVNMEKGTSEDYKIMLNAYNGFTPDDQKDETVQQMLESLIKDPDLFDRMNEAQLEELIEVATAVFKFTTATLLSKGTESQINYVLGHFDDDSSIKKKINELREEIKGEEE
jgi:hypothetical protein